MPGHRVRRPSRDQAAALVDAGPPGGVHHRPRRQHAVLARAPGAKADDRLAVVRWPGSRRRRLPRAPSGAVAPEPGAAPDRGAGAPSGRGAARVGTAHGQSQRPDDRPRWPREVERAWRERGARGGGSGAGVPGRRAGVPGQAGRSAGRAGLWEGCSSGCTGQQRYARRRTAAPEHAEFAGLADGAASSGAVASRPRTAPAGPGTGWSAGWIVGRRQRRPLEEPAGAIVEKPVFARLKALEHRMSGRLEVRRRVLARGVVTTAHVPSRRRIAVGAATQPGDVGAAALCAASPSRRRGLVDVGRAVRHGYSFAVGGLGRNRAPDSTDWSGCFVPCGEVVGTLCLRGLTSSA